VDDQLGIEVWTIDRARRCGSRPGSVSTKHRRAAIYFACRLGVQFFDRCARPARPSGASSSFIACVAYHLLVIDDGEERGAVGGEPCRRGPNTIAPGGPRSARSALHSAFSDAGQTTNTRAIPCAGESSQAAIAARSCRGHVVGEKSPAEARWICPPAGKQSDGRKSAEPDPASSRRRTRACRQRERSRDDAQTWPEMAVRRRCS